MPNIREEKNALRNMFIKERDSISQEYREKIMKNISRKFFSSLTYKDCDTVLLYSPIKSELNVTVFYEEILKSGRTLGLPKCNPDDSTMVYYKVSDPYLLEVGAYGIKEPLGGEIISNTKKAICVLPALAYDKRGFRLGYGKGYYDRYLNNFDGKKIGLIYSGFVVDKLPVGKYDKKVDLIFTEKEVIFPNEI